MESSIEWVFGMGLAIASVPALVANFCLCFIAINFLRTTGQPSHVFIASMSLADGLATLCYPFQRLHELGIFALEPYSVRIIYGCLYLFISASALSLTLMNLDRLVYFHIPIRYQLRVSLSRALKVIACAWLFCSIHALTGTFLLTEPSANTTNSTNGYNPWRDDPELNVNWYSFHYTVFGVIPVVSSACVSIWLVCKRSNATSSLIRTNSNQPRDIHSWKLIRFIAITTGWTAIACLPSRCYILVLFFMGKSYKEESFLTYFFLVYVTYLEPLVNPILLSLLHQKYNHWVRDFLLRVKHSICSPVSTHTQTNMTERVPNCLNSLTDNRTAAVERTRLLTHSSSL